MVYIVSGERGIRRKSGTSRKRRPGTFGRHTRQIVDGVEPGSAPGAEVREMKKTLVIIAILVVGGVSFIAYKWSRISKENGPQYTRITAERGSITKTVAASGSVTPNLDVEIKCKASGEVVTLPYDLSDKVQEGDLLVELDREDEERNVELSRVTLHESQARLSRARENLGVAERDLATSRERAEIDLEVAGAHADDARAGADRIQDLFDRGFVSQEEYEQSRTQLVAAEAEVDAAGLRFTELASQEAALALLRQDVVLAQANVESAEINLRSAQQRLEDTRVYAPMDGIVTARYVQIGQIIASGISNTTGGTPVMTISDLSRLYILARVDESDIGEVETGQRVVVSADAYPDESFEGTVDRIAPIGVNVSNVVTFEVRIEVTSENKSLLMPEMTADVEIVVAEKNDALLLRANALASRDGRRMVLVLGDDGKPSPREVETGIDNGQFIEIISGLSETDVVLVSEMEEPSMWRSSSEERQPPPPGVMGMGGPR